MPRPALALRLVLGLTLLTGCGGTRAAPPGSTTRTFAHAPGGHDLVLRIATVGGFLAPSSTLTAIPEISLYGDGTLVGTTTAERLADAEPASTPLRTLRLEPAQVEAALAAAAAAGALDQGLPYGDAAAMGISDASTTTVTMRVDGATHTTRAYALTVDHASSLSDAQATARGRLRELIGSLGTQLAEHGAGYQPAAYRVFAGPLGGESPTGEAPRTWPLPSDIAHDGLPLPEAYGELRCLDVGGADAATLARALASAAAATPWRPANGTDGAYRVVARPLLPDEAGCAAGGASQPSTTTAG